MRIAIDARKLHDFGVGTYIRNLIRHLARLDDQTEYLLLCDREDCSLTDQLGENFRVVPENSPPYSVTEQLRIPLRVYRERADLFHAPHYVLPAVDALPVDCDDSRLHPPDVPAVPAQSSRVRVCPGGVLGGDSPVHSYLDGIGSVQARHPPLFKVPSEKVTVIPNAIDERFRIAPAEEEVVRVRERYQLQDRFVLYAGNVRPHKNLERLLDAFFILRREGVDNVKLLIIGNEISKYATLRRAVHRYNLHKHVRFLGFVPAETLAVLYRLADGFVFPSLYEGFGLPPLEAMASGTPVLTSNVSSLPEVVGDAAILINPYDPRSIADGMRRLLTDATLRQDLTARGLARAHQFSWDRSVSRIREIYGAVGQGT